MSKVTRLSINLRHFGKVSQIISAYYGYFFQEISSASTLATLKFPPYLQWTHHIDALLAGAATHPGDVPSWFVLGWIMVT